LKPSNLRIKLSRIYVAVIGIKAIMNRPIVLKKPFALIMYDLKTYESITTEIDAIKILDISLITLL